MKTILHIFLLFSIAACKKGNSGDTTLPNMTFADVSMAEGNGGTSTLEIKLTLSKAYSQEVSVNYSTIEGTAKATSDFTPATNQTVTFQPNETEKKVQITIVADDIKEGDEIFQVKFDQPKNVFLAKSTGEIKITNDDTKVPFNNTGFDAPTSYAGYNLVWSDEFNGTALDAAAWTPEIGDGCPSLCGWGNNELEYYTNPPNNLYFQDGKMIIEAKAETFGGRNYTSSKIVTRGKKTFKFGRIDIRAILPKGKGIWPAFWLLPQDNVFGGWPRSGEIDLMEMVGHEAGKTHGTLHFGPGPGSTQISRNYSLPTGIFNDQFHVFSLEWKQDEIKWLLDGNVFSTVVKADLGANNYPFNETFFLIFNLAVGGNWPGAPDAATVFPQWLIVDYIRVYQQ